MIWNASLNCILLSGFAVSVWTHPFLFADSNLTIFQLRYNSKVNTICQTLPVGEVLTASLWVQYFLYSHAVSPSGNFSFIFSGGDTMKTATCGAACHTQQERPASLLGKVLYWINQPLLFLNQYCKTIKGSRDGRHTQKPAVEVEGPAGSSSWKYRVWFRSKENSWSGNNRTFQKNTAVPPSLPAALTLSVSQLSVFLSLWLEMFILHHPASVCLSVHVSPTVST